MTDSVEPSRALQQSESATATVVCTLGMHRSGTSLAERLLNLLGVYLGPDSRVLSSGKDNPKGFWEHVSFVEINDSILERFGGRWDRPPAFPPRWPHDPCIADLMDKARRFVAADFAGQPLWGWKDPRTSLTLPFWQEVVGPMRYVVCLRNPATVVDSLISRNQMSGQYAERLWLAHMRSLLDHSGAQPRMFVSYEDILEDWPRELRRLAAYIGHPERAEDPRVLEAVSDFLEIDLCHHRNTMSDLASDKEISFPTKSVWLALRGCADRSSEPIRDLAGLDRTPQCADAAFSLIASTALDAWDRTAATARALDDLAHARDAAVHALNEIKTSCAWSLVTYLRRGIVSALPEGTRRRQVFNAVLRRVTARVNAAGLRPL